MGSGKKPIADLPANVSVYPIETSKGYRYWRVLVGKRFTGGGIISKNFRSVQEARKWIFGDAQKFKANPGSLLELKATAPAQGFSLTPARLAEACDAFRRLDEIQMTLTEAIDFVVKRARPAAGTISVGEAIEKAQLRKESKRPTYRGDLVRRWRRFEKWLPAAKRKTINSITQMDVRKFLTECKLKPKGENNMRRNLSVFFSWALDHHYMTENPCKGIKVEKSDNEEPPRILSIAEVVHLLKLAQQKVQTPLMAGKGKPSIVTVYPGDLIPYLAVGLWAGVRPEESIRMEWQHIDFERKHIDLPAKIAKDHQRRIIPMEPNLIEWLMAYRPASGQGKIIINHEWKFRAFTKAANFSPWPKDCLRHSYGSYHLAKFQHAGQTAEFMGHANPDMLYKHYRDVIKEQGDIDAFWELAPS